jgi:hypothetical protein
MARDFKVRIAVGDTYGARSPVWLVFTRGNDVYAAHRSMANVEKISFHQSKISRRAFTNDHGIPSTMTDRVMQNGGERTRRQREPMAVFGSSPLASLQRIYLVLLYRYPSPRCG